MSSYGSNATRRRMSISLAIVVLLLAVLGSLGALLPVAVAFAQAVSFSPATNFLVAGLHPASVAIGDLNGDGKPDLATANIFSDSVSILLGAGTGAFGPATDFVVGAHPTSVAIGDLNGDGKPDLAVANLDGGSVSILLGTGTGSFGAATNFPAGFRPISVAIADLNADGKADLATANSDFVEGVAILLGDGAGAFGAPARFVADARPSFVAIGDLNGDGKPDLAVTNSFHTSNNVSILLGTGTGAFGAATNFDVGTGPQSVAIADLNGDGKLDLAVANEISHNVSVLLGTGTGAFGAATNFAVGSIALSVKIADLNGDGKPDLAVTNGNAAVSILLGTGTGGFGMATDFSVGTHGGSSVAISDLNADGKPDLAVTNNSGNTAAILLNTTAFPPSGCFTPTIDFLTQGDHATSVAIADLNGDGKPDLAVANRFSDNVSILLGTGGGGFGAATTFPVGSKPVSVAIADLNGDGKPDLATANLDGGDVSILLGDGAGGFGADARFPTSEIRPFSVTIADLNADGKPDLATSHFFNDNVSILLGIGGGAFGPAKGFSVGGRSFSVAIGDLDRDGKPDLAVANIDLDSVSILLGTGGGEFGSVTNFAVGTNPIFLAIADLNGDGKSDVAVANDSSNDVSILLGIGNGAFHAAANFPAGLIPASLAIGDLNGDGNPDLAVVTRNNAVSILLGTGTGAFGAAKDLAVGTHPYFVAIGDLDGDGKPDLAVTNRVDNSVSILLNTSLCPNQPTCPQPPSGMVSWWPGDGNANDIQDGNHGTLVNGATFGPGKVGQSFRFDGVDDGVSVLKTSNLNMGPSDFSIEAWVNVAQTQTPLGFIFLNYGGLPTYSLAISSDAKAQVHFRPSVPSLGGIGNEPFVEATGTTSLNDGRWHHLVGVRNGATALIYVDGVLENSVTNTEVLSVNGGSVDTGSCLYARIGAVHSDVGHCNSLAPNPQEPNFFHGLIDEVKIYNRALTACEIQAIVNAGTPRAGMGTVIIRKNTAGGNDTFGYTASGAGVSAFNITTSAGTGSQAISSIAPGLKTVTESSLPSGWLFTSLVCSDPDSGTTVSGKTANIDLDPDETIVCTYTNTKCPAINLNPAAGVLPATVVNTPYSQTITATGGCASSFTFGLTGGAFPPGLTLDTNGLLSGTPTQAGDFSFSVTTTDSCGCSQTQNYTLKSQNAANAVQTKTLVISAFRENGPNGALDEFIEIFNPSNAAVTVGSLPGVSGAGIGVFSNAGNNAGTANNGVFLRCQIPSTTVIKARGWYLCGGSDYSLSNLGGNGFSSHSALDASILGDIPNDAGLVLMNVGTNNVTLTSTGFFSGGNPATIFDSVGFQPYGPGAPGNVGQPSLAFKFCEGTCLVPVGDASTITLTSASSGCPMAVGPLSDPFAFPVRSAGFVGGVPICYGESGQYTIDRRRSAQQFSSSAGNLHRDTDNNADDFILDAPNPSTGNVGQSITGVQGVSSVLGAAGPHGMSAPPIVGPAIHAQDAFDICAGAVNPCTPGAFAVRNFERRFKQDLGIANAQNDPLGTFILRRRFFSISGSTTGARYRIDDITTLCGGQTGVNGFSSAVATQEARNLRGTNPTCQGEGADTGVFAAVLKAVNHGQETVVDSANITRTVLGTVLEDTSVGGAGNPALVHQPFGGGSNSSFVATTATAPTGDGVNGGAGSFSAITGPQGTVFRIAFKFGVVKSGRFKLLLGSEVNIP